MESRAGWAHPAANSASAEQLERREQTRTPVG